jgi:hypothetical protein
MCLRAMPIAYLNLQGFKWLDAYFVELKQMFRAAASVQNFNILSNTVKTCRIDTCEIPRKLEHRQLEDVPVVVMEKIRTGAWNSNLLIV